jgi:Fur family ferric uptake transcriptional regulator
MAVIRPQVKKSRTPPLLPCGRTPPVENPTDRPKPTLEEWEEKLHLFLVAKGLKHSEQRMKIARVILGHPSHFGVQELVKRVQEGHAEIGAATVYRTVNTLCEAGLLTETLSDQEGQSIYEVSDDSHHDHVVCTDCGEIFEFHDDAIEAQQKQVLRAFQFEEVRHRHVIYAQCLFKSTRSGGVTK